MPKRSRNGGETAADRAYEWIKARIVSCALRPGDRLDPEEFSKEPELGVSATPVREALNRLFAEELIERGPRLGYVVTTPTADAASGLYRSNLALLSAALRPFDDGHTPPPLRLRPPPAEPAPNDDEAAVLTRRTRELFRRIAALSGEAVIVRYVDNISDRLSFIRHLEHELIDGIDQQLATLEELCKPKRLGELESALVNYHAVRLGPVAEFLGRGLVPAFRRHAS